VNTNNSDLQLLTAIGQAIFDKKGFNILALDVQQVCTMTDYFVFAEGNVDRHVKGLAIAVNAAIGEFGRSPLRIDGMQTGDWVVIDFGDIVVHLLTPEMRERYAIEQLWREGIIVDLALCYDPPLRSPSNLSSGKSV
jgi:ribosome-associated protein